MTSTEKVGLGVVERQAKGTDLPLHRRTSRISRRGLAAGPLRSLRRRQTINPLVLAGLVAMAVVSALTIPSLVGRTPVRIASEPVAARAVEPRAAMAPELPRPAASPAPPMATRLASPPVAPKPPSEQARTPPRPTPPALSLDMLPVLIVDADEPDAAKLPARKTAAQRRPDTSLRPGMP